jgi:hypothetical protein
VLVFDMGHVCIKWWNVLQAQGANFGESHEIDIVSLLLSVGLKLTSTLFTYCFRIILINSTWYARGITFWT